MVTRSVLCAALLMAVAASSALAKSPRDTMFPGASSCYARTYSKDHLAKHPAQRVTKIAVSPEAGSTDRYLTLHVNIALRGVPGGQFEAYAYCENEGGHLYCGMEGDAGGFQISPAKGGAILVEVSSLGMGFENGSGFAVLERNSGDDRSFLLQRSGCK